MPNYETFQHDQDLDEAETLNLSAPAGYEIGGAVHIIVNNNLGFTTDPADARYTCYACDLTKGFEIPIVHVNADDPEACLAAAMPAYAYRERVIDGYPNLREVIRLQEEPKNMGAWRYMAPRLRDLIGRVPRIDYIGRPDLASPAEGSPLLHRAEQVRIVAEAFSGLQGSCPVVSRAK